MAESLSRLWRWLASLLWPQRAERSSVVLPDAAAATFGKPQPRKRVVRSAEDVRWVFRGAILDRLDEYFYCIDKLRRFDPDAYALFTKIGAAVPADRWMRPPAGTPYTGERPMTGAVTMTAVDRERPEETVAASLFYFTKIRRLPFSVEATEDDVYQLTVIWDDRMRDGQAWHSKSVLAERCHLALSAKGDIRVLRERGVAPQHIPARSPAARRGGGTSTVYHLRFGPPKWLVDLAKEKGKTAQEMGAELLLLALETWREALGGVRIAVRRNGVTASFGIELNRAPYFFADRGLTDGRKRKIFHAVRSHIRTLPDGRTSEVKAHYRGTRCFAWGGYEVEITKPGAHLLLIEDGPGATMLDDDEPPPNERMVGSRELGETLDRVMNG